MPYPVLPQVPNKRRRAAVAAGTLLATVLLAACGATTADETADSKSPSGQAGSATQAESSEPTATAPPGPARKLADIDGDGRPAEHYEQVLAALAPRCKEGAEELATVVDVTLKSLREKGVDGETEFSVLQHLEHWVPAGQPRIACASSAKDYAASRDAS
ncbi:hypothetical protein KVH07_12365 [Streptomyces olivaceus]|uniref:hypothetical protein n=1 Tax=Streptomyces olivaceus TaxID=47716 RepID=UPI001CCC286B|nr:hypothetical protein [Streptomyces olivaceus]MBZ6193722.1 hypothetical protein [Streptomyces olivaceus]